MLHQLRYSEQLPVRNLVTMTAGLIYEKKNTTLIVPLRMRIQHSTGVTLPATNECNYVSNVFGVSILCNLF